MASKQATKAASKAMILPVKPNKTIKKKPAASTSKALTEGDLIEFIAMEQSLTTGEVSRVLENLAETAKAEVVNNGVFTVPGICRIKARTKPATKAGTIKCFGGKTKVTAKQAQTTVTACAVLSLKKHVRSCPLSV